MAIEIDGYLLTMVIFHGKLLNNQMVGGIDHEKSPKPTINRWYKHTKNNGKLVGGDWNHGILNDFPFSWEFHRPN